MLFGIVYINIVIPPVQNGIANVRLGNSMLKGGRNELDSEVHILSLVQNTGECKEAQGW